MDECSARDVLLVQAIETADTARTVLRDADRIAVGEAAAKAVGAGASVDAYLGRRAALTLAGLDAREPRLRLLRERRHAGPGLVAAAVAVAFVAGIVAVHIGNAHRINLLAPPVLVLLAWNVAVYLLLAIGIVASRRGSRAAPRAGLRGRLARLFGAVPRAWRQAAQSGPLATAVAAFTVDWMRLAAPLWQRRATYILHAAAAALALGEVCGLYLRGIALEYRAAWESTFLGAADVARILQFVLAPGTWMTGIAVPGADVLRELGPGSPGENAARWIHLYAGTILVVVVVPRLLLAAIAWAGARQLSRNFPLRLDTPYHQRILRAWREGAAQVYAVPYSFDLPAAGTEGLRALLARAFESPVDLEWSAAVRYGDDALPAPRTAPGVVLVVFSLAATPEAENHGAIVGELAARFPGVPVMAIVDSSDFALRFRDVPRRITEREAAWRQVLEARGVSPLFVALAHPDFATASASLNDLLERAPR